MVLQINGVELIGCIELTNILFLYQNTSLRYSINFDTFLYIYVLIRERDKRLEEDIKRASEEKDPFVDSRSSSSVESSLTSSRKKSAESTGGRRASGRFRDSDRKTRSSSSEAAADVVGPSICPASPFHSFVRTHAYVHWYIHTYIHTHIHTYIYTHTYIHTYMHAFTHIQ